MAVRKYSRQRESIREMLLSRKDHPTADAVYADIRKIYPNISLGTVYRNLSLLAELGEIKKLSVGDGSEHYDADTTPHNHFTCRCCHAVIDLDMEDVSSIKETAAKRFDGDIEDYSINFYGVCGICKSKSS
ncbi:MAG: transcriptional repressor [Lachnospiraceae bacterium]|nr:transcriptional repressor [Lachnospiraceae bacterium]